MFSLIENMSHSFQSYMTACATLTSSIPGNPALQGCGTEAVGERTGPGFQVSYIVDFKDNPFRL